MHTKIGRVDGAVFVWRALLSRMAFRIFAHAAPADCKGFPGLLHAFRFVGGGEAFILHETLDHMPSLSMGGGGRFQHSSFLSSGHTISAELGVALTADEEDSAAQVRCLVSLTGALHSINSRTLPDAWLGVEPKVGQAALRTSTSRAAHRIAVSRQCQAFTPETKRRFIEEPAKRQEY
ncbi:MAG: hypothetical protein WCO57_05265 [Verrucomicrobiota bacterium]